jgi:hypothetical protein
VTIDAPTRSDWGVVPSRIQSVEIIGTHLRVSGDVDLGGFSRLSDFTSLQSSSIRLQNVTIQNRRGMPTADRLRELTIRLHEVALIAQRSAVAVAPSSTDVQVTKQRRRILAMTTGHLLEGTVSLYPGADLIAYMQAGDPPFLPLIDLRARWLADRRLKTSFEFGLLNRAQLVAVAAID